MIRNVFFTLMLLLASGYSKDMMNCRKLGEMSNNINGLPLYSTGLYMCLELPNQEVESVNTNLLDYSKDTSDDDQFLSNSSISNSQNSTNSSLDINTLYNSSHVIKNNTNLTTNIFSPSSTTTFIPSTTTPSPITTTPSPITTTPAPITTTLAPITTTPAPSTPLQTTTSPTTPSTLSTTKNPPEPVTPSSNPIDNLPDKSNLQNNTQESEHYNKSPSPKVTIENNPLLPIVITLISIILLVFCCACCKFLYNQKRIKKIFTNNTVKTDKKEEPDLESGEKKNRNSWTFSHKNMAQEKLRAMEQFKKSSKFKTRSKKQEMKPRLKPVSRKQQEFVNKQNAQKTPPNPKIAAATLKGLSRENKKKVRETLMERAKDIPGGKNNPNLQKMLNRFPETPTEDMDNKTKKWYKEEFQAELDQIDIMNNKPLTPPPPLPVPTFNQQTQPPVRRVYGNPNNKSSPKMTINEINPESPIRN